MKAEREVIREILLALGKIPDCRVFRHNVGKARDPSTGQVVTFGTRGMTDLQVILRGGSSIWMEVKSATGTLRPEQHVFRNVVTGLQHRWVLVRSAREAVLAVEQALAEERALREGPGGR